MNRYDCFDDRNCDNQFDDNSCKHHHPKDHGCTEKRTPLLTLNGADLAYTVVGRATGSSQIVGMAIVETTVINSVLTVRNSAANAAALTITPLAGGTQSVSAHLVITQIQ